MQILHTDLMEKYLNFIDLKIPYSGEFFWYWQIFSKLCKNGSKYQTLNITEQKFQGFCFDYSYDMLSGYPLTVQCELK